MDYKLITSTYTVTQKVLGSGNYGKVYLGYQVVNPDYRVAVKAI